MGKNLTPRKKLKKEIAQLKYAMKMLPFYADISYVYGDNFYSMDAMPQMEKDLAELQKKLSELPPPVEQTRLKSPTN